MLLFPSTSMIWLLLQHLKQSCRSLRMKCLTNAKWKTQASSNSFFGIQIKRTAATIELSQSSYIETLLEKFEMQHTNPSSQSPCPGHALEPATEEEQLRGALDPYRSAVGGLIWLAVATRPDISHATNKGLRGTSSKGLVYRKVPMKDFRLFDFADATWSDDSSTGRSTTGVVMYLCGAPISWICSLQKSVALS